MDPEERKTRIRDVIHRLNEMQDRVRARGRRDATDGNSYPYVPDDTDARIKGALDELHAALNNLEG